jgi:hypothetical protein
MSSESTLLAEIIEKHNRTANMQVIFIDVEKYSRRRTITQGWVIDSFTVLLRDALQDTAKEFVDFAGKTNFNFQRDIIILPTGDGAAVVFPFTNIPGAHLFFAKALLKRIYEKNHQNPCEDFLKNGWCNCHANLYVRIGISDGHAVVYKDINGGFNVAGGVINMAARVMGMVERSQIAFTKPAYERIIDMVDDPYLVKYFVTIKDVKIKHGERIDIFQYIGQGEPYINSSPPAELTLMTKSTDVLHRLLQKSISGDEVTPANITMLEQVLGLVESSLKEPGIPNPNITHAELKSGRSEAETPQVGS